MDKTKGKYLLLLLFLPVYFIFFCIGDLISVLGFEDKSVQETAQVQMAVDGIILLGLIMYILGYLLVAAFGKKASRGWYYHEWDYKKIVIVGFACWVIGTRAFIQVIFLADK
jgi:hypothetical protein